MSSLDDNRGPGGPPEDEDMSSAEDVLDDDSSGAGTGVPSEPPPASSGGDMFSVDEILGDDASSVVPAPETGGDMFSVDDILGSDDVDAGPVTASPPPLPVQPPASSGGDMFSVDEILGDDASSVVPAPETGGDMFSVDDGSSGETGPDTAQPFGESVPSHEIPEPPPEDFFGSGEAGSQIEANQPFTAEPEAPAESPFGSGSTTSGFEHPLAEPDPELPEINSASSADTTSGPVAESPFEPEAVAEPPVFEALGQPVAENPFEVAAQPNAQAEPVAENPFAASPPEPSEPVAQDPTADKPEPAVPNPFAATPEPEVESAEPDNPFGQQAAQHSVAAEPVNDNPFAAREEQAENPFGPPLPAGPFGAAEPEAEQSAFEPVVNPFERAPAVDSPPAAEPVAENPFGESISESEMAPEQQYDDAGSAETGFGEPGSSPFTQPTTGDAESTAIDQPGYEEPQPAEPIAAEPGVDQSFAQPPVGEQADVHYADAPVYSSEPQAYRSADEAEPPVIYGDQPPEHHDQQIYEDVQETEPPRPYEERTQSVPPPGWDDVGTPEIVVSDTGKKPKRRTFSSARRKSDDAEEGTQPEAEEGGRKVFGLSIGGGRKKQDQGWAEGVPDVAGEIEDTGVTDRPDDVPDLESAAKTSIWKRLNKPIGKKGEPDVAEAQAPDSAPAAAAEKKPSLWKRLNKPVGRKGQRGDQPDRGEAVASDDASVSASDPAPQTYAGGAAPRVAPLPTTAPQEPGEMPIGIHTAPVAGTHPESVTDAHDEPSDTPFQQAEVSQQTAPYEPGAMLEIPAGDQATPAQATDEPQPDVASDEKKPSLWQRLNKPVGKKAKAPASELPSAELEEPPPADSAVATDAEPAEKKPSLWQRLNKPVGKKDRSKFPDTVVSEAASVVAGPAPTEPATPAAASAAGADPAQQQAAGPVPFPPQFPDATTPRPEKRGFPAVPVANAPEGWSPAAEPQLAPFAHATQPAPSQPADGWQMPAAPVGMTVNDPATAFPSLATSADLPRQSHGTPATLEKRILALFVDGLLMSPLAYLLTGVLGLEPLSQAFLGLTALAVAVYFTTMTFKTNGQTLGKMAVKIRVVPTDGKPVDRELAVTRETALKVLMFGLFGGLATGAALIGCAVLAVANVAAMLRDDDRRALHDRIARTRVVEDR